MEDYDCKLCVTITLSVAGSPTIVFYVPLFEIGSHLLLSECYLVCCVVTQTEIDYTQWWNSNVNVVFLVLE